jgi:hypothetical protein
MKMEILKMFKRLIKLNLILAVILFALNLVTLQKFSILSLVVIITCLLSLDFQRRKWL